MTFDDQRPPAPGDEPAPRHAAPGPETDPGTEPAPLHERPAGAPESPFAAGATQVRATHRIPDPMAEAPDPADNPASGAQPPRAAADPRPADRVDEAPRRRERRRHPFLAGFAGGVVASVLVAILLAALTGKIGAPAGPMATTDSAAGPTVNITANHEDATTAEVVAAKCLPSVASINVSSAEGEGVGSGVVYDTDGNILTNFHVVDGAQSISVSLGGKSYEGTVVGSDESSDLAVVHIDLAGDTVTPMERGSSSDLVVGEWVMALGSPFGLDQSVSTGIVSSLYRSTILEGTSGNTIYTNLIQTDTAINPGNSGGALVNSDGQLVGINSIIESASGSSSGVGFAIPSDYAVSVADAIIEGRQVEHAYLGANVATVTPQAAARNRLAVNQGAYVASVTQGGPAAEAGLAEGDIITRLGDEEVTSADGLILAVRSHAVGDTVTVTYYRGSDEATVDVTLGSDAQTGEPQRQQSLLREGASSGGAPDGLSGVLGR